MFALLIPTGSDHDCHRPARVTLGLIAVNVVLYFVTNFLDAEQIAKTFGFVAADPRPYQFVTHMFLHMPWPTHPGAEWTEYINSVLHIGGNMAYLWFAGRDLEDALGPVRFLALYLVGGVASALLFWCTALAGNFPNLDEPAVGASGAVSALLGLYLVRFPRFKIRMWFGAFIPIPFIMRQGMARISSVFFIAFWIGLQLVFGFQALKAGGAEVAYWGHIGGFLLGLAYGLGTKQWLLGQEEYLLKEAEHLFYRQKWYPAMEAYQILANRYPRCAAAFIKWALCWECTGNLKRAEKVLLDAETFYQQQGWTEEEQIIKAELQSVLGARESEGVEQARQQRARELAEQAQPGQAAPSLLFRREFKWKDKKK